MKSVMTGAHKVWEKSGGNINELNNYFRANDVILFSPVKNDSVGTVSTTNADVTMGAPAVGYETWSGYYFVTGTMNWKKIGTSTQPRWYNDHINGAGDAEIVYLGLGDGKLSGFKNKGYYLSIRDKNGNSTAISNADNWYNSGVYWRPQDSFSGSTVTNTANYNIDSYLASLYFEYTGGAGTNIPIFSQYAHTWRSTNITGFSIENNGLGVQFADTNYGWKASAGPAYYN